MPVFGSVFVVDWETFMFWKSCCIATFYCPCLCFERVVFSLTLRHLCPCLEAVFVVDCGKRLCSGRVVVRVYFV